MVMPFGSARAFPTITSVTVSGANPTSATTAARTDSNRAAARMAHASYCAG
jgi:hypothetical protein